MVCRAMYFSEDCTEEDLSSLERTKIKKADNTVGKYMEQLKLIHAGGEIKWHNLLDNSLAVSCKTKHILSIWPRNSSSMYLHKRNKNILTKKIYIGISIDIFIIITPKSKIQILMSQCINKLWYDYTLNRKRN